MIILVADAKAAQVQKLAMLFAWFELCSGRILFATVRKLTAASLR